MTAMLLGRCNNYHQAAMFNNRLMPHPASLLEAVSTWRLAPRLALALGEAFGHKVGGVHRSSHELRTRAHGHGL